jgi:DNA-binding MarR family transcriptional regulator
MNKSTAVKEIRAFNRYYTNVIGVINRHFLDSPYSLTEVRIMFEIHYNKHATVRKIRNLLMVNEGYLSRTIDRLKKLGITSKRRSPSDGRSYILSLTAKGEKNFNTLERRQEQFVKSMIDHLSAEELKELLAHMRRIKEILAGRDDAYGRHV